MNKTAEKTRERSIILVDREVRRVLDGTLVEIRRPAKPPTKAVFLPDDHWKIDIDEPGSAYLDDESGRLRIWCPFGEPGTVLWVREVFLTGYNTDDSGYLITEDDEGNELPERVWYRATDDGCFEWALGDGSSTNRIPWRSSATMPRHLARLFLINTGVRVERDDQGVWQWVVGVRRADTTGTGAKANGGDP